MTLEPENPVHYHSGPNTRWTTVNYGEAIPGIQTPYSWTVWDYGMERATRRGFGLIGVLRKSEVPVPKNTEDRASGIFYGRATGNVNVFRALGERLPGTSGDVLEQKVFGEVSGTPSWGDDPGIAGTLRVLRSMPVGGWKAVRKLPGILEDQRTWWRRDVVDSPPRDLAAAQRLAMSSAERHFEVCTWHCIVSMLGPGFLEQLSDLADKTLGDPTLGMDLATGYGGMEETEIIADVWAVAQERLTLDAFMLRHGFHARVEGQVDSHSWREDAAPVETMLRGYAKQDVADPRERERDQIRRREETEQRILAALPAWKRSGAKLTMKIASSFILAREQGKAAFLHALDGARCGARSGAEILVERGFLDDPEDVFFLTLEEFCGPPSEAFKDIVAERKANHERYHALELPPAWNGNPVPIERKPDDGTGDRVARLEGIGVVGDKVTGRARVIEDPADADFDDGDILVCKTTDPSWTPLFMLAEALVIDTGGQMSHGAIVARELGVCCVINTVTGTRDIPDGATITVDGSTGVVEIEER